MYAIPWRMDYRWHNDGEHRNPFSKFRNYEYDFGLASVRPFPRNFSRTPITTGTSIVSFQFKDGIVMAGDIVGSYGSLARYRNLERLMIINNNILLGASGDYGDFQFLKSEIKKKIFEEQCLDDGFSLKPKALYSWLTRIMYNKRSHFDPLWNNFVIAGIEDDKPFLGTIDKLGSSYTDPVIATGYGAYMATPVLRKARERNENMCKQEALEYLHKVMEVLYFRDARAFPMFHVGIVTKDKVEIKGPVSLNSFWDPAVL